MPELPEVQTIVTTLRPSLVGRALSNVRLLRRDILHPDGIEFPALLDGRSVADVSRRGKKIIIQLDNGSSFFIHLGMSGRLTLEASASQLQLHTHLVISLPENRELRFTDPRRFGGIWWIGADYHPDDGMGPEALEVTAEYLTERLAKTTRAIKTALLDQGLIAGLGNIYADEALFEARIHPATLAHRLKREQIVALTKAIKAVLLRALKHKGSTLRDYRNADGEPGDFQKLHRVYDRAGKPCQRCGTPLKRIVLGGRSTHFCSVCQMKNERQGAKTPRETQRRNTIGN